MASSKFANRPTNEKETQPYYVPLRIRFKSVKRRLPKNRTDFYFMNAQLTNREYATLDVLYPVPQWIREERHG